MTEAGLGLEHRCRLFGLRRGLEKGRNLMVQTWGLEDCFSSELARGIDGGCDFSGDPGPMPRYRASTIV